MTPLIEETLKEELTEANYEASWAATRSCQMADIIKEKVKGLQKKFFCLYREGMVIGKS